MTCFDPPGVLVHPAGLTIPRAKALCGYLDSRLNPYAALVETRQMPSGAEVIVLDLDIEVPQVRANGISCTERLAVAFEPDDSRCPEVLALRQDFPWVPHANLRAQEFPRSLCMFDLAWSEQRLRLAPGSLVEWMRTWLRDTANGSLHRDDQPLEPMFLASTWYIVLPSQFFDPTQLDGACAAIPIYRGEDGCPILLALPGVRQPQHSQRFIPLVMDLPAQTHGVIRHAPANLGALHRLCGELGFDLATNLARKLSDSACRPNEDGSCSFIILLRIPRKRTELQPPEAIEIWAFMPLSLNLAQLGHMLGIWGTHNGLVVPLIQPAGFDSRSASSTEVVPLRPVSWLSRQQAARQSSVDGVPPQITIVGAGALGSQILLSSVRSGFGSWTCVDNDLLLPHNLGRHALTTEAMGGFKAPKMAELCNAILEGPPTIEAIVADVLAPGDKQQALYDAFERSDAIVDCSASVAVARHLATDVHAKGRRISLFLNPRGTDLVVLAEDSARSTRLDSLEMQYLAALTNTPSLSDHMAAPDGRLRYSMSCRDVTSVVQSESVTAFAGIGGRALRRCIQSGQAAIEIWCSNEAGEVSRLAIQVSPVEVLQIDGWSVVVPQDVLQGLQEQRRRRLPNETGGVLVGHVDHDRNLVYLARQIPSPPDSEEWPSAYIRGCTGLPAEVARIEAVTDGWLTYLGEWHSHPSGSSPTASHDDLILLGWLRAHLAGTGRPGLMLIVADHYGIYVTERSHHQ
ncbi:MAG: ThiF family adenylyltransferase [Bryobacterales bacterium]|nr:ThiF family adenylyltransferase [Bryobacterales bacterium]